MTRWTCGAALALLACCAAARAGDIEAPPISYGTAPEDNAVSRLQERLDSGRAKLTHEDGFGYLRSLLRELDVPASSQVLVFSKTSFQRHRIAPQTPRALYFNDDVYVGFCQNGDVLEVAAADPRLGMVFYTAEQAKADRPRFSRQDDACLICHGSSQNQGFPGALVRSVYVDPEGLPILSAGSHRTDHSSPLEERWGGWYVTGKSGRQMHLGNLIVRDKGRPEASENAAGVNLTDLAGRIKAERYLNGGSSDIVALMVLEHQAEMHNRLIRADFLTRTALHDEAELNKALGKPADNHWDSTATRIKSACEPLVQYLLFAKEAPLTDRVEGASDFAKEFSKRGPRDAQGRSLRDFDLERRLFKYPCSYLIYSASFDGLPAAAKEYVYRRLWEVLSGKDTSEAFRHLTAADRRAVLEILLATKENLPDYWKVPSSP